jgi:hypothetical protein
LFLTLSGLKTLTGFGSAIVIALKEIAGILGYSAIFKLAIGLFKAGPVSVVRPDSVIKEYEFHNIIFSTSYYE